MLLRIVLINNGYAIYSIKHSEEERSISLKGRYVNATITVLDIIDRLIFYLKRDVSEIVLSSSSSSSSLGWIYSVEPNR
jgi:hypothetical protein